MISSNPPGEFYLLSVVAVFALSLQSTLMAAIYRQMDRLSAIAYRGLTLGLTMLPLLIFVNPEGVSTLPAALPYIAGATITATFGNWCAANTYRFLPVGVASALSMGFASIITVLISFFALGETLQPTQQLLIAAILVGNSTLGLTRSDGNLPQDYNPTNGIATAFGFGVFLGLAYVLIGIASRTCDPLLAGYCWEFSVGIVAALIASSRKFGGRAGLERISKQTLWRIAAYSSPTAFGTGAFSYVTSIGPIGIATAIISTLMVSNTILAWPLYGERLSRTQCVLIGLICALVFALRWSSN
jgi:drug/metabolite transporter (DMT)-like permease